MCPFLYGAGGNRTHINASVRWTLARTSSQTGTNNNVLDSRTPKNEKNLLPTGDSPHLHQSASLNMAVQPNWCVPGKAAAYQPIRPQVSQRAALTDADWESLVNKIGWVIWGNVSRQLLPQEVTVYRYRAVPNGVTITDQEGIELVKMRIMGCYFCIISLETNWMNR